MAAEGVDRRKKRRRDESPIAGESRRRMGRDDGMTEVVGKNYS